MQRNKLFRRLLLIMFVLVLVSFYRLPYFVQKPGVARELQPMIEVEGGNTGEAGTFMLTTVQIGKANLYTYALAHFNKYEEILTTKDLRLEGESEEEYNVRQLYYMENSKHHAVQVAYEKANKEVRFDYKGVYVLKLVDGMPASKVLKAGDRIIKVDGHQFSASQEFIDYVGKKQADDIVRITFLRNNKEMTKEIAVAAFDDTSDKVGIGVQLVDDREMHTDPAIHVDTEGIGGPSAGLMFSLEIYNQLTEEDITHGYFIAGTGTISPNGEVGRIGGIDQKVVAAHRAGADLFFAPDDEIPDEWKDHPDVLTNYEEAKKTAKDIGTNMKIVPVKTFDDALLFLGSLDKNKS